MNSGLPAFVLRSLMSRTWVSVLGLCGAAVIALFTWIALADPMTLESRLSGIIGFRYYEQVCDGFVQHGVNLGLANPLVAFSGIAFAVGVAAVRAWRRLLVVLLLLEAISLSVAISLVAAYSAAWVKDVCVYDAAGRSVVPHLEWLFFAVWGVPLALLLLRAFGAWKGVEPPPRRFRTPRVWQTGA